MSKHCHSCSAPLESPEFAGPVADYCKYCVDEKGNLKAREEIQRGIAEWMKSWQPGLDDAKALERAASYMRSMPAWDSE
jgi:hypothetical protein